MATTKREPKRVRSMRRRSAHHADRARKASTPVERFRAAQDALLSAVAHSRAPARTARGKYEEIAEHVRRVLDRGEPNAASAALYDSKLKQSGTDSARLGNALMCLRGAISLLPETERDRLFEHYARHLGEEAQLIDAEGGDR
ncbi:hypothetical protein SAMN04487905_12128 [Actinopolyspora xinjiangensis]|uniref:Uncharacterized protein n=1 Tax=Actinopolyspora xinjiangensis TaxID=405564 RepID=A0A1H0X1H2_9ACTN|nr:hypothetical protein [Actinopolyspora xinjiangensis]SDP96720.1 hypothetical protein SAMN04487905_12128 [Actinopolyspora xinjiangensis]